MMINFNSGLKTTNKRCARCGNYIFNYPCLHCGYRP